MATIEPLLRHLFDTGLNPIELTTEMSRYMTGINIDRTPIRNQMAAMIAMYDNYQACAVDMGYDEDDQALESYQQFLESLVERQVSALCDAKPELCSFGILTAWHDAPEINLGDPGLIVSQPIFDPDDDASPIDIESNEPAVIGRKLDYALRVRGSNPAVLLVADGGHWTMLAISKNKIYQFIW